MKKFNKTTRIVLVVFIAVIGLLVGAANYPVPAAPKGATTYHVDTTQLLALTNQDRAAANVSPLTLDSNLSTAAMFRCNDMVQNHYYSHTSPTGVKWSDAIKKYYQYYTLAGENIAQGQYSAESVNQAWLASPEHRANIIKPDYTLVGLAVCPNGSQQDIVEEFMQPYVPPTAQPSTCMQPSISRNRYNCADARTYPPCIDGINPYDGTLYCI